MSETGQFGHWRPFVGHSRLVVFKLVMAAAKTWRRLKAVQGAPFTNGVEVLATASSRSTS